MAPTNGNILQLIVAMFAALLTLNVSLSSVTKKAFDTKSYTTATNALKPDFSKMTISAMMLEGCNAVMLICFLVLLLMSIEVAYGWMFAGWRLPEKDYMKLRGASGRRPTNKVHECLLLVVLILSLFASVLWSFATLVDSTLMWWAILLNNWIWLVAVIAFPFIALLLRRRN